MIQLDKTLVRQARRTLRRGELTEGERVAINLFRRQGVRVSALSRAFQCSRNTIYYNCLTGEAPSYPRDLATETNAIIEEMGEVAAWDMYVTPPMVEAVNAANKEQAAANLRRAA